MSQFGSVCGAKGNSDFDLNAANVACRSMGFERSAYWKRVSDLQVLELDLSEEENRFLPVWMAGVKCYGNEPRLSRCRFGGCTNKPAERLSYGAFERFPFR